MNPNPGNVIHSYYYNVILGNDSLWPPQDPISPDTSLLASMLQLFNAWYMYSEVFPASRLPGSITPILVRNQRFPTQQVII